MLYGETLRVPGRPLQHKQQSQLKTSVVCNVNGLDCAVLTNYPYWKLGWDYLTAGQQQKHASFQKNRIQLHKHTGHAYTNSEHIMYLHSDI